MMNKAEWRLLAISILPLLVTGCVGAGAIYVTECESSLPICNYTFTKEKWGPGPIPYDREGNPSQQPNYLPSKEEFLVAWGEPNETIVHSEDEVTLVYQSSNEWCGGVAVWVVVPAPLMLPVCETFDRITFKGSKATHLHFKRLNAAGFIAGYPVLDAEQPTTCPKPCSPQAEGTKPQPVD